MFFLFTENHINIKNNKIDNKIITLKSLTLLEKYGKIFETYRPVLDKWKGGLIYMAIKVKAVKTVKFACHVDQNC